MEVHSPAGCSPFCKGAFWAFLLLPSSDLALVMDNYETRSCLDFSTFTRPTSQLLFFALSRQPLRHCANRLCPRELQFSINSVGDPPSCLGPLECYRRVGKQRELQWVWCESCWGAGQVPQLSLVFLLGLAGRDRPWR